MSNTENHERTTALETKMSHLEQQLEDMHEVILDQARSISFLKAKLKMTESKIEEIEMHGQSEDGAVLSPIEIAARDKPPHY